MADNDYNIIKPVEGLHNVGDITAAKRREERKKRQNSREREGWEHEPIEDELNESNEEGAGSEIAESDRSEHSIDYRA